MRVRWWADNFAAVFNENLARATPQEQRKRHENTVRVIKDGKTWNSIILDDLFDRMN